MKVIGAILFSLFFLLTSMQQTTLLLLFKLNEKAIVEQYCINKNRKDSHCNGACHLKKTIVKTEKEDTGNPFSLLNIKIKEVEVLCHSLQHNFSSFIFYTTPERVNLYHLILLDGFSDMMIKPPTAMV